MSWPSNFHLVLTESSNTVIVTEAGAYDNSSAATQAACRTDQTDVLKNTPWFR